MFYLSFVCLMRLVIPFSISGEIGHLIFTIFWDRTSIFLKFLEISHPLFLEGFTYLLFFWWDLSFLFPFLVRSDIHFFEIFVRSDIQFFPLFLISDFTFRPSASSGPRFQHFWDRTSSQSEIGLYARTMKSGPIAGGATQVNGEYLTQQTQGVW